MKTFRQIAEEVKEDQAVCVSVPLFIKILEWAREEAKTDEALHELTERLMDVNEDEWPADMDDYAYLVGKGSKDRD